MVTSPSSSRAFHQIPGSLQRSYAIVIMATLVACGGDGADDSMPMADAGGEGATRVEGGGPSTPDDGTTEDAGSRDGGVDASLDAGRDAAETVDGSMDGDATADAALDGSMDAFDGGGASHDGDASDDGDNTGDGDESVDCGDGSPAGVDVTGTWLITYPIPEGSETVSTMVVFLQEGDQVVGTFSSSDGAVGDVTGVVSDDQACLSFVNETDTCEGGYQAVGVVNGDTAEIELLGEDCTGVVELEGTAERMCEDDCP